MRESLIFKWETEKERAARHRRIPAKQKLEWLYQINEFVNKFSSAKTRKIRQALRNAR
jgi:hypothetical protein